MTKDTVGIREDLEDTIYRIDPTEVPFTSLCGRTKATARYHEWQIQKLATAAAAGANAAIEGADAAAASTTPTTRPGNRTQIMTKTAKVAGSNRVVDAAGRADEMSYQVLLKGLELRRDMEVQLCTNGASQVDNGSVANLSGGFESWITTNDSRGASGVDGGYSAGIVAAPTDGTQRTFTESLLKTAVANAYGAGGKPTVLMLGTTQKQNFSAFVGIAVNRYQLNKAQMGAIIGAADVYVSDFGQLAVVPNIFQRNRTALIISPKFVKIAMFRGMRNFPLAKAGDADARQILVEMCLEVCNEAAHSVVADLT